MQIRKKHRRTVRKVGGSEEITKPEVNTDLLDEIDRALEGIDELLAITYHQKGGE